MNFSGRIRLFSRTTGKLLLGTAMAAALVPPVEADVVGVQCISPQPGYEKKVIVAIQGGTTQWLVYVNAAVLAAYTTGSGVTVTVKGLGMAAYNGVPANKVELMVTTTSGATTGDRVLTLDYGGGSKDSVALRVTRRVTVTSHQPTSVYRNVQSEISMVGTNLGSAVSSGGCSKTFSSATEYRCSGSTSTSNWTIRVADQYMPTEFINGWVSVQVQGLEDNTIPSSLPTISTQSENVYSIPRLEDCLPPPPLSWTLVAGATKYRVEIRRVGGSQVQTFERNATQSSLQPPLKFQAGQTYRWKARAEAHSQVSPKYTRGPWSTEMEFQVVHDGTPVTQNPHGPNSRCGLAPVF